MTESQIIGLVAFRNKLRTIQGELGSLKKNASNPHFKSKYADLEQVHEVVKPVLTKYGLRLSHVAVTADTSTPYLKTIIEDDDGNAAISDVPLVGVDNMQKLGAAITYARRYGIVGLLALDAEDDDAELAVGRGVANRAVSPAPVSTKLQNTTALALIETKTAVLKAKKALPREEWIAYLTATYNCTDKTQLTEQQARQAVIWLDTQLAKIGK